MICIVMMVILGVLSLFSARYKSWAKEAFDCVFKRIRLKPCTTDFDAKVKNKITAKLIIKHPKIARFTHKNFEIISWIFVILMIVSFIWTGYSVYNLAVYKSCDPQHPETCVFTPKSDDCGSWKCWFKICNCGDTCGTKVGADCEGDKCNTPK